MKRLLLGFGMGAAMLFMAGPALAAGLNLAWSSCAQDGGLPNRTFACASNAGSHVLTGSFVLGAPLADVSGNEQLFDLLTTSDPLPAWWDMKETGTCRPTSIAANFVYTDNLCIDWSQGQGNGAIGAYTGDAGAAGWTIDPGLTTRHRRIKCASAVPPSALQALVADQEYFSINVTINSAKTVGTGACAGCSEPVCIVLNSIRVTTPILANDVVLGDPTVAGSNFATWQGTGPDCQLVPTRKLTWGAVKSLYR